MYPASQITERTIDEVIEETFENRFNEEVEILKKSIEFSSDNEVLALANFQMPEKQSDSLSFLLAKNSQENLAAKEKEELKTLMRVNRFNELRKAICIVEALKRGLIKSAEELS